MTYCVHFKKNFKKIEAGSSATAPDLHFDKTNEINCEMSSKRSGKNIKSSRDKLK